MASLRDGSSRASSLRRRSSDNFSSRRETKDNARILAVSCTRTPQFAQLPFKLVDPLVCLSGDLGDVHEQDAQVAPSDQSIIVIVGFATRFRLCLDQRIFRGTIFHAVPKMFLHELLSPLRIQRAISASRQSHSANTSRSIFRISPNLHTPL